MANPKETLTPEAAQRLAQSIERVLAAFCAGATAAARGMASLESVRSLPGPLVSLPFQLSRGVVGAAALILGGSLGVGLARLLLGEEPPATVEGLGPGDDDALGELANQAASSVATAVGELVKKSVGFESPSARWLAEGGAGLSAAPDALVLTLAVSAGALSGEAHLLLPRAVAPAPPPQASEMVLPSLGEPSSRPGGNGLEMLLDVSLPLTVELGRTRMMIRDILHLAPGSVLELDKLAGEPVDIMINEKSIARGEVVVIDESFGVRLTTIVTPSERVVSLR